MCEAHVVNIAGEPDNAFADRAEVGGGCDDAAAIQTMRARQRGTARLLVSNLLSATAATVSNSGNHRTFCRTISSVTAENMTGPATSQQPPVATSTHQTHHHHI